MSPLYSVDSNGWNCSIPGSLSNQTTQALEEGRVIVLPNLSFHLESSERALLAPEAVRGSKNISYDLTTGLVGGTVLTGLELGTLRGLLERFARASRRLVEQLFPAYQTGLRQGRTSLRPVEAAGRALSWRKDDTRLHVDSFPSQPMAGNRILRVFSNINDAGQPRVWRIGGPFEGVVRRFWSDLRAPLWGNHLLLSALRITKTRRTPYDHFMLQLHDRMKENSIYQERGEQLTHYFPAMSTWIVYTDQVPHAAMSGLHLLEQTFSVPVGCLRDEPTAPLRVLERLAGRKLA